MMERIRELEEMDGGEIRHLVVFGEYENSKATGKDARVNSAFLRKSFRWRK